MTQAITLRESIIGYLDIDQYGATRVGPIRVSRLDKAWNYVPPYTTVKPYETLPPVAPGLNRSVLYTINRTRSRLANVHDSPQEVGFRRKVKLGSYIPPHPYTSAVEYSNPTQWGSWVAGHQTITFQTCNNPGFSTSETDLVARDDSLQRFWAHARRREAVSSGVALATLRETIGLTGSAILTILELLKWIKRGRFDKAVDALLEHGLPIPSNARRRVANYSQRSPLTLQKWSANAWLELQFGWKPLLQDIYDAAGAYSSLIEGEYFPTLSISGKGATVRRTTGEVYESSSAIDRFWTDIVYEVDYSISGLFKIINPGLTLVHAFGLDNPLSIAWDLVPFSFVVDWFLPIKRYIDNLSALNGLELIHATEFKRSVYRHKVSVNQRTGSGYWLEAEQGKVYYNRSLLSDIPQPNFLKVNIPSLFDSWKFTTSFSLLEQRRR